MALKQNITNTSGATTEYHRISGAVGDLTAGRAYIIVLSYLNSSKRDEEKTQAANDIKRMELKSELEKLNSNPTSDNKSKRDELEKQLEALNADHNDGKPRNMLKSTYEFSLPENGNFSLELAYNWLKENVYTNSEDC